MDKEQINQMIQNHQQIRLLVSSIVAKKMNPTIRTQSNLIYNQIDELLRQIENKVKEGGA